MKQKMKKLCLRTNGKAVTAFKQTSLLIALNLILIPIIIDWSGLTAIPVNYRLLQAMFFTGGMLVAVLILAIWLLSRISPVKSLKIRKKLILFTRLFLKSEPDGIFIHSVNWHYTVKDKKIFIDLYPNGLVKDTSDIGKKLSEYLGETLLKYEELDGKARYIFGKFPERYNGNALLEEGISAVTGEYTPMLSYEPVPIYDNVTWDFTSEALHILLLAPSGSGKTMFLNYLAGMVLKRQHMLYVIDAKNSPFGGMYRNAGVQVATNIEEIISLLTALVQEMEERYAKFFATGEADIDDNFATLNLKGHVLIFDEILSVLKLADRKERAEIEKLLGQIALKGRAAGIALVITAQKLKAEELPKSITEQCQTRLILGRLVSEETFHLATGLYKKDIGTAYRGNVGKGYAVTPKSDGLCYIETPYMLCRENDYKVLLKELRDRGTPYGQGR